MAAVGLRQPRIQPGIAAAESSVPLERKEKKLAGEALPAFLSSLAERRRSTGRTYPGSELLLPPPLRALLPCCRRPSAPECLSLARERNSSMTGTSAPPSPRCAWCLRCSVRPGEKKKFRAFFTGKLLSALVQSCPCILSTLLLLCLL